ncbi:cystathione beta-lyase [Roseovarius pacificus]|uniref:cysteine-S-conjugate beta-lyase n=1 Tax=Roseovarius pacificus TaxID=337701 RepID=A0A1M7FLK8_9RHOB|nr:MalY/PatB family protein [Roseovarius pacificus]GGO59201.1 aminotransferase [Roseovarius pacificus]SHM04870.1 cystathione beta-lyase [Roseovarius pacificus]
MNFDDIIDRRGHLSSKWDMMEKNYGVPAEDGLAMWVADMDFRSPDCIQDAVRAKLEHGIYGYLGDYGPYTSAIAWWMENRHGWQVDPDWILTTTGLCNAVGLAIDTLTSPGDSVVLFTPVYHAFARVIRTAGRNVLECPLVNENGRYRMDFDACESLMTGKEKMMILCSPHNPGGRVWNKDELRAVADFARRHDLLLISDEVHHDLVYPGQTHTPMPLADPGIIDRLIMLTAPSKTFNIAGTHTGQMIVSNDTLRGQLKARMSALSLGTHDFGIAMTTAAYSPEGAAWVDELVAYLDGNRKLFDDGVNAIPGVTSMPLEATYLSWVDFSGTGMKREEYKRRVNKDARIAVNYGSTFGSGGETFLRFNIGMPRAQIAEAVERLQAAFADLQ